jgi:glycosyltransferase involved in cell wall biosynthesis
VRILLLTPDAPTSPRSGFGLVADHTARAISRAGVAEPRTLSVQEDTQTNGRANRAAIARSLLRGPLNAAERRFVERTGAASRDAEVAIWFGSPWDPITLALPRRCACRLVHHPNDSITLFERRRAQTRLRVLRVRLAQAHERRVLSAGYAATVYVSEQDAAEARRLAPVDQAHAIPLGIDLEAFRPGEQPAPGVPEVLFAGAMAYGPNHEAAMCLLDRVLPFLPAAVRLRVVGRDPSPALRATAARDPRVEITGAVADITAEYRRATVFAAPVISGAGSRNKLLEAMASGLPVVTTSLGVESFGSQPPGVLVADDPSTFAAHVNALLLDAERRRLLGVAARKFVESGWSWDRRTQRLLAVALGSP